MSLLQSGLPPPCRAPSAWAINREKNKGREEKKMALEGVKNGEKNTKTFAEDGKWLRNASPCRLEGWKGFQVVRHAIEHLR